MSMLDSAPNNSGIASWFENNPTIALGGVLVVVLLGGAMLMRKKSTVSASVGSATDLSGLTNGTVYVPTQTAFTTENSTDASQTVTNTGPGNVNTGSSSAGNVYHAPTSTKPPVVKPKPPTTLPKPPVGTKPPVVKPKPPTTLPKPLPPVRHPPVTPPERISLEWTQHISTSHQSLDTIAHNASISMNGIGGSGINRANMNKKFTVTGQQIYNQNKDVVDDFFLAHHIKSNKLNTATVGLALIIPQLDKK